MSWYPAYVPSASTRVLPALAASIAACRLPAPGETSVIASRRAVGVTVVCPVLAAVRACSTDRVTIDAIAWAHGEDLCGLCSGCERDQAEEQVESVANGARRQVAGHRKVRSCAER